ncbi:MAG: hypothetical protein AAGF11_32430 [Myxococcota bacterium]
MTTPNYHCPLTLRPITTSSAWAGLALFALLAGCAGADEPGRPGADDGSTSSAADDDASDDIPGADGEGSDDGGLDDGSDDDGLDGSDDDGGDSESTGGTSTGTGVCGDGVVDPEEDCDDATNDGDYGGCNADCTLAPHCGDGIRNSVDEICDDGNTDLSDGCLTDCTIPASCEDIKLVDPDAEDDNYIVDSDGEGGEEALLAYCDMSVIVLDWGEKHTVGTFGTNTGGADVAVGEVGAGAGADMVLFHIDDDILGSNDAYYRIGWNLDDSGDPTLGWTEPREVPGDFGSSSDGAGISLADVDGNGMLDLVVAHIDDPLFGNHAYYRIGWDLDDQGDVIGGWSEPFEVPGGFGDETVGAGVAVLDLDGNDVQDMVLFHVQDNLIEDEGYYQVGWDLDVNGQPSVWSDTTLVPGGFGIDTVGAGVTALPNTYGGKPSLVIFQIGGLLDGIGIDGYIRVGRQFDGSGVATGGWSDPIRLDGSWVLGSENGGIAAWDLHGDGHEDLLFFDVTDNPLGENPGQYQWGYTQ